MKGWGEPRGGVASQKGAWLVGKEGRREGAGPVGEDSQPCSQERALCHPLEASESSLVGSQGSHVRGRVTPPCSLTLSNTACMFTD